MVYIAKFYRGNEIKEQVKLDSDTHESAVKEAEELREDAGHVYVEVSKGVTALEFLEKGSGTITICGSTKFFFEAMECNRRLTFMNWMVYQCGSWGHSFSKYMLPSNTNYAKVKILHFQKILCSQAIVVVSDESNYIGSSTKAEIEFATTRGIPVFYFNGENFSGETSKIPMDELEDTSLIDKFAKTHGLGF